MLAVDDGIITCRLNCLDFLGITAMSDELPVCLPVRLPVRLDDLQLDEIQELLEEEGIEASAEQVRMITAFIASVGGLENAQGLFDELRQLRPAA